MITVNDHKQALLFDPWKFLSPKRRQLLEDNWPGLFRNQLLDTLPVDKLMPFFSKNFGRPSKELYTVLGALLLQQAMDLSDEETVEQLAFNIQWHYALNILEESDAAKYICTKTLWTMRRIMIENNLDRTVLDSITGKLAKIFNVNTDKQRLDSVHICSNMRRICRISIFSHTIHKFLINLKRHHNEQFEGISEELRRRYISPKALNAFALLKPSAAAKTLEIVSRDLLSLVDLFQSKPLIPEMSSYKLMKRILAEQCEVSDDSDETKITVKPSGEVGADSLQNPSDPDATYDGHKGQGYQVQVMETFTDTDNKKAKEQTLNLITHVSVEKACQSDACALMPAIADTQKKGLRPAILLADAAYGGDDNMLDARKKHVELIAPAQNGNKRRPGMDLSAFKFDDRGRAVCCPEGHTPDKIDSRVKKDRYSACFNRETCEHCPSLSDCPVQVGKKYSYLRYSQKDYRLTVRRMHEKTEAFIEKYRWRAGIEATMSEYNTLTGVKRLRVRGYEAVRYCATLKATAVNIFRAAIVNRARKRAKSPYFSIFNIRLNRHEYFKPRFRDFRRICKKMIIAFLPKENSAIFLAA
jgi:hypothetical protein